MSDTQLPAAECCVVEIEDFDTPGDPDYYGPFTSPNLAHAWCDANGIKNDDKRVTLLFISPPETYGRDQAGSEEE